MLRNMLLCAVALALGLIFTACQTSRQPTTSNEAGTDITAINALRSQFAAAYNAHDAAAAADLFASDAVLMLPNQPVIEGRPAIQAMLENFFKKNDVTFAHAPLETQVAGNWAYERGDIALTVTPKSGKTIEESIKYIVILKRQSDGGWKIHLNIDNSNLPPAFPKGMES